MRDVGDGAGENQGKASRQNAELGVERQKEIIHKGISRAESISTGRDLWITGLYAHFLSHPGLQTPIHSERGCRFC